MVWILVVLTALCGFSLLAFGGYASIVSSIFTGLLVSTFIWLITVERPERKVRGIIVNNLKRSYRDFKHDTIKLLLQASGGSLNEIDVENLCNHKEFRAYFKDQNWYGALNGIQSDQTLLNDLIVEFDIFLDTFRYAMNNLEVRSERVHLFYRVLQQNIYRLKNSSSFTADQTKYLGNFLYEMLGSHCAFRGPQEHDIFENEIVSQIMRQ